jgi:hypothetical protein
MAESWKTLYGRSSVENGQSALRSELREHVHAFDARLERINDDGKAGRAELLARVERSQADYQRRVDELRERFDEKLAAQAEQCAQDNIAVSKARRVDLAGLTALVALSFGVLTFMIDSAILPVAVEIRHLQEHNLAHQELSAHKGMGELAAEAIARIEILERFVLNEVRMDHQNGEMP